MMPSSPRTISALVASALLAGAAACRLSQPLTKKEAATLVSTSAAFQRPKYVRIPRQITVTGRVSYGAYGAGRVLSIFDLARIDPAVAILQIERAVEVNESTFGADYQETHVLTLRPTAKLDGASLEGDEPSSDAGMARQERVEEDFANIRRRDALPYGAKAKYTLGWRAPVGTRELVEVQQIHNYRDANLQLQVNELAVDFTWRWHPNELGDSFDSESETMQAFPDSVQEQARRQGVRMYTAAPLLSRAFLTRRGKQWVLEYIQWDFGRGNPT